MSKVKLQVFDRTPFPSDIIAIFGTSAKLFQPKHRKYSNDPLVLSQSCQVNVMASPQESEVDVYVLSTAVGSITG